MCAACQRDIAIMNHYWAENHYSVLEIAAIRYMDSSLSAGHSSLSPVFIQAIAAVILTYMYPWSTFLHQLYSQRGAR